MSKKKVPGKYLKSSSRYGISEWDFDADEECDAFAKAVLTEALELGGGSAILHDEIYQAREALVKKVIKQGIENALTYDVYACIASDLSKTPLNLFVELPLGGEDGANPTWIVDFPDVIDAFICNHQLPYSEKFDPENVPTAIAVRDALRALADQIDAGLTA